MSRKLIAMFATATCLSMGAVAGVAYAHHSIAAEYGGSGNELTEFTGTVDKVRWSSPHIELYVTVTGGELPKGEEWILNSHAPGLLARTYNVMPGEVKAGDAIKIFGWKSLYDTPRLHIRAIGVNGETPKSTHRGRDGQDAANGATFDIVPAPGPPVSGQEALAEGGFEASGASDYNANIAGDSSIREGQPSGVSPAKKGPSGLLIAGILALLGFGAAIFIASRRKKEQ